ncbi:MAG: protein kinase [Oscillatoria sp. SIO1A7]|nr:protein kinase [Oscillatoria sp. SIO1A7]
MSYCFNPTCQNPQNQDDINVCQSCGWPLRLQERYTGTKLLGEGGVNRTFLARDNGVTGGSCIIKQFLPAPGTASETATVIEIFNQEARRLQKLGKHPKITEVLDYFEENGYLYLVKEFVEGHNLLASLETEGALSEEKIWFLLKSVLQVMEFIHSREVIHRDLSLENLLRTPEGSLVLIDFGISQELARANLVITGTTRLRKGYIAPEQLRLGKAYPASDLYSLGVICIQLLTGVSWDKLYSPRLGRWIWREILKQKQIKISDRLGSVLDKLLEDAIENRYETATQVFDDCEDKQERSLPTPEPDRSLYTLIGHSGWVWSVAFSPDSQTLASTGNDRNIILWDASSGERRRTLTRHSDLVLCVTFNPNNGTELASGSRDKTIVLWDIETGKPIRTLRGWLFFDPNELINSVAFSPDGKTLASGSWDNKVILWNASNGRQKRTFNGHSDWVYSVAFSPDGKTLASGSRDELIMLWDISKGQPPRSLNGNSGLVNTIAFSPDGRLLASGYFKPIIIVWDLDTEKQSLILRGHSDRINAVAFSPDGKILASASFDRNIILWDIESGDRIDTLRGHSERILCLAFSPDGRFLASGAGDETVKIWQVDGIGV